MAKTIIDLMEYATDEDAQLNYETDATYSAKLLSLFNGADEATTYTAETGQIVTFVATAQLDTAQKEIGSSSLLLDGSGDYCTVPDSADWTFGSGNFTIDMWIRPHAVGAALNLCAQQILFILLIQDKTNW